VVIAPVGEHSAKPEEVRRRIERLVGGPYLELYGRKPVDAWTVWGNEIQRGLMTAGGEVIKTKPEPADDGLDIPAILRRSPPAAAALAGASAVTTAPRPDARMKRRRR
jgi:hypothetical protein